MERHPTGSPVFDDLLAGGYEKGIVTVLYGPAGSGKSNLVLLALTTIEGKAVFVDTEGSFSVDRLTQLTPNAEKLLERVVVLKAPSFEQQTTIIERIPSMIKNGVELVIVDGIATQYRAAIARGEKDLNNTLSKQINTLYGIAMEHNIPVLLTSQVYADMEGDGVKIIGGDIIKYSAKCLIELQHEDEKRKAVLVKHRSLPRKERTFVIDSVGVYEK
jgi:DNA repair protein RadB